MHIGASFRLRIFVHERLKFAAQTWKWVSAVTGNKLNGSPFLMGHMGHHRSQKMTHFHFCIGCQLLRLHMHLYAIKIL